MTIAFCGAYAPLIVMTVDSVETLDFEGERAYKSEVRKAYPFPGVGCVTTWGSREGNRIEEYLSKQNISPNTHSVDDLANTVFNYLIGEYKPHESNRDDVGYHVAGFDRNGAARLYHVVYGIQRPGPMNQSQAYYPPVDHSPPTDGGIQFLYNGRNDLADSLIQPLLAEISKDAEARRRDPTYTGKVSRFYSLTPERLAYLGDLVARFAAEITNEVGPPFYTFLISPHNQIRWVKNVSTCPINPDEVSRILKEFGYSDHGRGDMPYSKQA